MMTKGQFYAAFKGRDEFKYGLSHTFPCGREAVFSIPRPLPREHDEPLEAVQREPLLVFTRVGDYYVSGTDRFGTTCGSRLPHAYVDVDECGTITLYAETRRDRQIFTYRLGE